jgi:hypothetical protein
LFPASFQQSIAATRQFVGHQTGEKIDWCHGFHLGLPQARLQRMFTSSF